MNKEVSSTKLYAALKEWLFTNLVNVIQITNLKPLKFAITRYLHDWQLAICLRYIKRKAGIDIIKD